MTAFSTPLPIAGVVPTSTCDWEGKIVTTVFLQGCPLRCVFCHNPSLIPRKSQALTPEDFQDNWVQFLSILKRREGIIDGVVFSGGEPLLHHGLIEVAERIRAQSPGLLFGYHTSGVFPNRVEALVAQKLVDWVGLDIKASRENYGEVANFNNFAKIEETLNILSNNKISTEIRTTVHQDFFTEEDVSSILGLLKSFGYSQWVIQPLRQEGTQKRWEPVDAGLLDLIRARALDCGISTRVR